jgi:pilus assembly protein CpaB
VTARRAPLGAGLRQLGRAMLWHRRLLAAGLAAGSVAAGLTVLAPEPPPTVQVLAAARDLAGGAPLQAGDLDPVALPPAAVPDGALTDASTVVGRILAGPVRRGEPLTDLRLLGRELLEAAAPGSEPLVATPVRIADAGIVALLRPGDLVDVLAAHADLGGPTGTGGRGSAGDADGTGGGGTDPASHADLVATAVRVLSVPRLAGEGPLSGAGPDLAEGALIVVAATPQAAARLARAAVTARLTVTLRAR